MHTRMNPYATEMKLVRPLISFAQTVESMGLEPDLMELVKIRASQINGCAVCLHMHTAAARKNGETEERIYMLDAWRESSLYTERERAALAWTDALTLLKESRAPDDVYQQVERQFTPAEQVMLTLMISVINTFNRFGVGFRLGDAELKQAA
ncbi:MULTISPECIES: carboxymuconolactone decarboxylase family protein [unclassified Herbaspirillum]|uniref:carboxymuconolactone decarboxylase family protein n=1 Tax=unclassified Herbaspirillum TaxID=2624150 RepID=UPI00383BDD7E